MPALPLWRGGASICPFIPVDCGRGYRLFARRRRAFGLNDFRAEQMGEASDQALLHLANLGGLALKPVRPDLRPGLGQMSWALTVHRPRNPARAPFEQVSDAESAPDLSRVDRPLLVGEGEVAPDDEAILELRNLGREIVGERVSEICWSGRFQGFERQYDDGEARRGCELIVKRSA